MKQHNGHSKGRLFASAILLFALILCTCCTSAQHAEMLWHKKLGATAADVSPDGSRLVLSSGFDTTLTFISNSGPTRIYLRSYKNVRLLDRDLAKQEDSVPMPGVILHEPFFEAKDRVVIHTTKTGVTIDSVFVAYVDNPQEVRLRRSPMEYFGVQGASSETRLNSRIAQSSDRRFWMISTAQEIVVYSPPIRSDGGSVCRNWMATDSEIVSQNSAYVTSMAIGDSGQVGVLSYRYYKYHKYPEEVSSRIVVRAANDTSLFYMENAYATFHGFSPTNSAFILEDSLYVPELHKSIRQIKHTNLLRWLDEHWVLCADSVGVCLVDLMADTVVERYTTVSKIAPVDIKVSANRKFFVVQYSDSSTALWTIHLDGLGSWGKVFLGAASERGTYETFESAQFLSAVYPVRGTIHYDWDFGDGTHSTEADPRHWYSNPGSYSVKLSIQDPEQTLFNTELSAPVHALAYSPECFRVVKSIDTCIDAININNRGDDCAFCDRSGRVAVASADGAILKSLQVQSDGVRAVSFLNSPNHLRFGAYNQSRDRFQLLDYDFANAVLDTVSEERIAYIIESNAPASYVRDWQSQRLDYTARLSQNADKYALSYNDLLRFSLRGYQGEWTPIVKNYGGFVYRNTTTASCITNTPDSLVSKYSNYDYCAKLFSVLGCAMSEKTDLVAYVKQLNESKANVRTIDVYDCATNEVVYSCLDSGTHCVDFTSDGRSLFVGNRLIEIASSTTRELHNFKATRLNPVGAANRYLLCIAARRDSCLWLYDYVADTLVYVFGHSCDEPKCASLSSDARSIIVGGIHGTLQRWRVPDAVYNLIKSEDQEPTATQQYDALLPNPCSDFCTIVVDAPNHETFSISLWDAMGNVARVADKVETSFTGIRHCLDLSSVSSGIYYLDVSGPSFRRVQKLVVLK